MEGFIISNKLGVIMKFPSPHYLPLGKLIKGALSGLRPFLTTQIPLKMMKNTFYFTLKALFFLKIVSWKKVCLSEPLPLPPP